jgi:hypothetical protein
MKLHIHDGIGTPVDNLFTNAQVIRKRLQDDLLRCSGNCTKLPRHRTTTMRTRSGPRADVTLTFDAWSKSHSIIVYSAKEEKFLFAMA